MRHTGRRRFAWVGGGSVAAVALAAAASLWVGVDEPPTASSTSTASAVQAAGPKIEIQRSKGYTSISDLAADSKLVAYVTATSDQESGSLNGLPFTVTSMRIDRVLKGDAPSSANLALRQIGPGDFSESLHVVAPGHQYIVFLGAVSFDAGTTNGQWYVVGLQAGLFELAEGKVTRTDDASPQLPTNVPFSDFERAITG